MFIGVTVAMEPPRVANQRKNGSRERLRWVTVASANPRHPANAGGIPQADRRTVMEGARRLASLEMQPIGGNRYEVDPGNFNSSRPRVRLCPLLHPCFGRQRDLGPRDPVLDADSQPLGNGNESNVDHP